MARVTVRWSLWGLGLSFALSAPWLGCSQSQSQSERAESEQVAAQQQGLQMAVSEPLELEALPGMFDVAGVEDRRLVCGTQRCMLFYEQNFHGYPHLLAARVA